jgi:hypothetical protein
LNFNIVGSRFLFCLFGLFFTMNSFGWYTCSTYSTWELKNDSIHLYYNFSEYEQLNGASPYTKTPDSTLLSHFFGGSIFLQIKTIFGSKKVIPNYVEAYGYDKNGLNLTHDYYSKDYPYRWIKLKYSMALTDTLLFKNSVFCDTLIGSFLVGRNQDHLYDNTDNQGLYFNCEIRINLNTLKTYSNPNNKSVQFPTTFIISAFNQALRSGSNYYPDAIYYSPAAIEEEGDSISFVLSPISFIQYQGNITYMPDKWKTPHQYDRPFTVFCANPNSYKCNPNPNVYPPLGFYTNNKTGEIIFRSKYIDAWANDYGSKNFWRISSFAPVRFIIEEYRRDSLGTMNLIGKHDFFNLIQVNNTHQDKFNIAPRIESPQFEYYTCPDDSLIIPISTTKSKWLYSSLAYDTNFIFWDKALASKGAQFNIVDSAARDKKANFIWKTNNSHLRDQPYRFTVFTNLDTLYKIKDGTESPQWNSRTFLVYVRPKPQIFYHSQQLTCGRLLANVDSFVDMAGKWNFAWQLLDSTGKLVSNYNEKSIDLIVPSGGKWFLKIIATNDYAGCPFIAQDSFVVAPFMQFYLSDTSYICNAQPLLVAANASKGPSPYSYFWQSSTDTSHADVFLFDGRKDSTLKLTIKDANGCLATDSIAPKINVSPVFDLGFEGLALCQGDTLTLAVPDKVKHLPFVWQPNNLKTEAVHIASPQVVSLNVTDTFNQCTFGDTMTVSFFASPKASFQYSTVCDPSLNFTFNGNLPEGESAYTFHWQLPDTQFTSKDFFYAFKSFGLVPVKLQVQSQIGCFDTITQLVATGMQVQAQFTANDVCNGDTVVFNNTTQRHAQNNQMHYYWRLGNGANDTIEHPKYLYPISKTAKTFLVTLVANSAFCSDSITVPITVLALPDADFSTLFMNKTATLSALTIDNNFTYNWDLGDDKIASTPVVNHTYAANLDTVTICLTVISQENCSSTICKRLKTIGLFNPTLDQNGYKVYPNPNNGTFKLECPKTDNYQVELYDTKGQLIERYTFKNKQYEITLPQNSKGVYLLKIKGENSGVQLVMVVVH